MGPDGRFTHIHEHPEISCRDLELIRRHHATARSILDVGAGRGGFVVKARQVGFSAFGLDRDFDVVPLWRRAGVPGCLGDAFHPPVRAESFDVVRAKELIEHVADPLALVRALRALLTPAGIIVAHVPSPFSQFYPIGNFWDDYTHVRPFSHMGLRRLFEDADMVVRDVCGYTASRSPIERVVARVLSKVLPHTYLLVAQLPP